ncbi:hypothetical protein [Paraburkholderia lacunae]|nr:hypothetical protein [Paraburkholderia lacunae]
MKRILTLTILAVTLGSALGGCIVVPWGGYYDHYHGHEHEREHD